MDMAPCLPHSNALCGLDLAQILYELQTLYRVEPCNVNACILCPIQMQSMGLTNFVRNSNPVHSTIV